MKLGEWIKKNRKAIVLVAAALVLAVAAELCYTAVTNNRIENGNYSKIEIAARDFTAAEFESAGRNQYYTLANNSYFSYEGISGVDVSTIAIGLVPEEGDYTQRLLFFKGVKDGVYGEFMAPLAQQADGSFIAELNCADIESIKIYPTEAVRSTLAFTGVTLNPSAVSAESFSGARLLLWAVLALAAYSLVSLVLDAAKKRKIKNPWLRGLPLAAALGGLFGFGAIGVFSSAGTLGRLLIAAGIAGAAALYALVYLFAHKIKTLHNRAFAAILLLGAVFCFASAPMQPPDEEDHFLRAYAIASGVLDFDYNYEYPGDVYWLLDLFPAEYNNKLSENRVPALALRIVEYNAKHALPHTGELEHKTSIQVNLPYLPSALGIFLCRLLGGSALVCLWAGRLMNVLAFAFCARWALKKAARYRMPLLLALLLPITLFMVASLSYDAMFLCALAVFLGAVLAKEQTRGVAVAMIAAFALMIYIKPVYLPLCLLVFLIPKDAVKIRVKRAAQLGVLIAAGLALYAASLLFASLVDSGIPPAERLQWVDPAAQVLYVLRNPLRYAIVVVVDGYTNAFYLDTGGLFGTLDVSARLTGIFVPVVAAAVAFLAAGQDKNERKGAPWGLLGLAAAQYLVVVTSFYVVWSTLGSTSILGVQARYFIPVAFMVAAALSALLGRAAKPALERARAEGIAFGLCSALGVLAAAELFAAYFL